MNLKNLNVQEMDKSEMRETEGGFLIFGILFVAAIITWIAVVPSQNNP